MIRAWRRLRAWLRAGRPTRADVLDAWYVSSMTGGRDPHYAWEAW